MALRQSDRFVPRTGIQARRLDSGGILVDMDSGKCFELNQIGFEIWAAFGAGKSISEICASLSTQYVVDAEKLSADVDHLVRSLVESGLVAEIAT